MSRVSSLPHLTNFSWLGVLDAVLDYPTWYPLVAGFQTQFGNLSTLVNVITSAQGSYKNGLFGTGAFLENHDQPRFPSLSNDTAVRLTPCVNKLCLQAFSEAEKCDCLPVHSRRHSYPLLWCDFSLESRSCTLLMGFFRSRTRLYWWTRPSEPRSVCKFSLPGVIDFDRFSPQVVVLWLCSRQGSSAAYQDSKRSSQGCNFCQRSIPFHSCTSLSLCRPPWC